ncbi:glutathione S-transferase family protein [Consotaella salsifontis]|uniref:Glutathione S-transferase n=1 Tax=Consotaella salsifontis TaxID=1365950 RepID=A0A1T4NML5_9HYPH|nr:glutathione S-transferase family protein [Consotaella salsifontis]SJZ80327.1 glutathione S-transferase [Consotaella salsifontis]
MTDKLSLFFNPRSRAVIARWMLEEVEADYTLIPIEFDHDDANRKRLRELNPMGKIPTLILADGTVITEANAIIAYLADAYPQAGLAPALSSSERGTYYRWLFFVGSCLEPAMTEAMMRKDAPPLPEISAGWGSYDRVIETLEKELAGRSFLVGNRFTAADLVMGAALNFAGAFGAPRIRESATIQAYVGPIAARPALARASAPA